MKYIEIFEYIEKNHQKFTDDELDSIAFLCSSISQDRSFSKSTCTEMEEV